MEKHKPDTFQTFIDQERVRLNKQREDILVFWPNYRITDLIKRGKVLTPVEFGHKVFLAESAQGLITQYKVLKGNPSCRALAETAQSCLR